MRHRSNEQRLQYHAIHVVHFTLVTLAHYEAKQRLPISGQRIRSFKSNAMFAYRQNAGAVRLETIHVVGRTLQHSYFFAAAFSEAFCNRAF